MAAPTEAAAQPTTGPAARGPHAAPLLVVSAAVVLVTVTTWLALLIPAMPSGEIGEQLAHLADRMSGYRWSFVNAAIINPAFVIMLYAASTTFGRGPLRPHEAAGAIIVATYWLLPTVAYVAQFALLPRLLEAGVGAEVWYFGNPDGVSYWLAMTGYGLFGLGALLLASRFLHTGTRAFGWVLVASGATSMLGLVGYALGSEQLELGSMVGGALVAPLAILALVGCRRVRAARAP